MKSTLRGRSPAAYTALVALDLGRGALVARAASVEQLAGGTPGAREAADE